MNNIISVQLTNSQTVIKLDGVAELLDTTETNLKANFSKNKDKFKEGVDYFKLSHSEVKSLEVAQGNLQQPLDYKGTKGLNLWTESGLAMHAKLVLTGYAWDLQRKLVDSFFSKPKAIVPEVKALPSPAKGMYALNHPDSVNADYITIKEVFHLTGTLYGYRKLLKGSKLLDLHPIKVPSDGYAKGVNAYHKDVWNKVFPSVLDYYDVEL